MKSILRTLDPGIIRNAIWFSKKYSHPHKVELMLVFLINHFMMNSVRTAAG